jgi:hypothetical protein|tara:strand:- start:79 stop:219 length:141 start_codon:yes stop_codon:yes gene_type:complete
VGSVPKPEALVNATKAILPIKGMLRLILSDFAISLLLGFFEVSVNK